jgi:hypothetical protein
LSNDPIAAVSSAVEGVYAGHLEPVIYPEATFLTLPVRDGQLASGAVMAFDVSVIRKYLGRSKFKGCRAVRWSESLRAAVVVYGTEASTASGRWGKSPSTTGIGVLGLVGIEPIDAFVVMTVLDPPVQADTQCDAFRAILAAPKHALVTQLERPLGAGSTRNHRDVPAIATFLTRAADDAAPWTAWDLPGWRPENEIIDAPIVRPTDAADLAGSTVEDAGFDGNDDESHPGPPTSTQSRGETDGSASAADVISQIERLGGLRDAGYIDDAEFARLKAKLLG